MGQAVTTGTTRGGSTRRARAVRAADRAAAAQLGDVVGRLIRMLRQATAGSLGPSAISTLASVDRVGPIRLGELAEREGVTPPTLSRIVTGLESEGYVERQVDPDDRRSAFLVVTPLGRRLIEDVRHKRGAVLAERLTRLTVEEVARLEDALPLIERLTADS